MSISSELKRTSLLLIAVFSIIHLSAQDVTLSGYIKDASNGETLIGATARIVESGKGVVSNEYGFYSISLEPGVYSFEASYLGFQDQSFELDLSTSNQSFDIELLSGSEIIEEVIISAEAKDKNVTEVEMSTEKLDIATIKSMPTLLGEVEIIRSIQMLPGVTSVGEGATGFNVRGGSIDQNLVLLDEAPVYNSSHLFGNSNAVAIAKRPPRLNPRTEKVSIESSLKKPSMSSLHSLFLMGPSSFSLFP